MNQTIEFIINNIHVIFFGLFAITFISIIVHSINLKKKAKLLKETGIPRRFKYLDTFYFSYYDGENHTTIAINIIEELGNTKKYAMIVNQFENCYFVDYKEPRLVTGKKGFTYKMPKVEFNQQGNFWIDQEYESFCIKEDDIITINSGISIFRRSFQLKYSKDNSSSKGNYLDLYNLNKLYDSSILENATFITGVAEFDNIYNN